MTRFDPFNFKQTIRFSAIVILLSVAEICWSVRTPVRAQDSRVSPSSTSQNQWSETEIKAYWDAIEDARTSEANEISTNLTAITPDNRTLQWDHGRVLVVSWATNADRYRDSQPANSQPRPMLLDRDVWVTAVPELQNFCKNYQSTGGITLGERLIQLLGLTPGDDSSKRAMVEIWVDPQFLFRPSPDPEITDHEAELRFRPANAFLFSPLSYYQWFSSQFDQSYKHNGELIAPRADNQPPVDHGQQVWAYP